MTILARKLAFVESGRADYPDYGSRISYGNALARRPLAYITAGAIGRGTGFCIVFRNPKRERGLPSSPKHRVTIAIAMS